MAYADKLSENSIPADQRLYCHNPQCKRFINPKLDVKKGGKVGTCGHCGGNTCKRCGQKGHMFGVSQQTLMEGKRVAKRGGKSRRERKRKVRSEGKGGMCPGVKGVGEVWV